MAIVGALAARLLSACGSEDDGPGKTSSAPPTDGGVACLPGERPLETGRCEPAGLPSDAACAPGERPLADGGCLAAGVPPERCGEGFEPDGEGVCVPVLPEARCASGRIATVGDDHCRPLATCGEPPWGEVPTGADTEHVDRSYAGADADGSAAKPWPSIGAAVQAAIPGAIVAIAAGSYAEDLALVGKPVQLWGRCPALVEIAGSAAAQGPIVIGAGADGAAIRNVALTGPKGGLIVVGSEDLLVEGVWIHDTAASGLHAENGLGPVRLTVRNSLVERTAVAGIALLGVEASLEEVVVRDTQAGSQGPLYGVGIAVNPSPYDERPAVLQARRVLVERNRDRGVTVVGSQVELEASVVRATEPQAAGTFGRGIDVYPNDVTGERSNVSVRQSVVARCHDIGVFAVGSDLLLEHTIVRDTLSSGLYDSPAVGVGLWPASTLGPDAQATSATLRSSVVQNAGMAGVLCIGSELTVESTLVRDVRPWDRDQTLGRGLDIEDAPEGDERSAATVRWSVFERNHETSLSVMGSDVSIEGSSIRDTRPQQSDRLLGRGINLQVNPVSGRRPSGAIADTLVDGSREVGIAVIGGEALVERSVVRGTLPRALDGRAGRGVIGEYEATTAEPATVLLRQVLVEDSHEVGVALAGAEATIEWSRVAGSKPQQSDGFGGDGIDVQHFTVPSSAWIGATRVETSARAGIASFGGSVSLGGSRLDCNPIHLDGEPWQGELFAFTDRGYNVCGCGDAIVGCQVSSANLAPPDSL